MDKREINTETIKKIVIVLLAFIGLLTTIDLAIIYYDANFNLYSLPSFCSINEFIDCDGVAHTIHSQFFGIPLAYWGMGLYLFVIFLAFVDKLKNIKHLSFLKVFKHPLAYISALGFISFTISMILAGVSIFEIKKLCILCLFTYFLNLIIALTATNWYYRNKETYGLSNIFWAIYKSFKTSIKDFIHAIKIKKYLISFLVIALLASGALTYTSLSYCFTPQVRRLKEFEEYKKMDTNPFRVEGNVLGDKDAKTVVYVYTDYRCPICRVYNVILYRAAKELGGFRFEHKNLPLDIECNSSLQTPFHEGSCMLARYSVAAKKQGHLWDFNSDVFEKEPKTEADAIDLAKSIGLNVQELKADAYSKEAYKTVSNDIDEATEFGIDGTPTIVINGKLHVGITPYYKLKELLMEAGAFERKK